MSGAASSLPIKVVFFDVGGVLVVDFIRQKIKDLADRYGKQREIHKLLEVSERIRPEVDLGKLGEAEFWTRILREVGVRASKHDCRCETYFRAIEGVQSVARDLRAKGIRVAILSNDSRELSMRRREQYGFDSIFDDIIISSDHGMVKPDEEIFRFALQRSAAKAEECVFIDDREENVATARALGFHAIRFENVGRLRVELAEILGGKG
jgi:epoxide hydrolase-like predicted phosphatase